MPRFSLDPNRCGSGTALDPETRSTIRCARGTQPVSDECVPDGTVIT